MVYSEVVKNFYKNSVDLIRFDNMYKYILSNDEEVNQQVWCFNDSQLQEILENEDQSLIGNINNKKTYVHEGKTYHIWEFLPYKNKDNLFDQQYGAIYTKIDSNKDNLMQSLLSIVELPVINYLNEKEKKDENVLLTEEQLENYRRQANILLNSIEIYAQNFIKEILTEQGNNLQEKTSKRYEKLKKEISKLSYQLDENIIHEKDRKQNIEKLALLKIMKCLSIRIIMDKQITLPYIREFNKILEGGLEII